MNLLPWPFNMVKKVWNGIHTASVFMEIKDKLGGIFTSLSAVYGVVGQLLKTGEAILSKIALSGVSVACLTVAGFFTLLQTGLSKLLGALQSISDSLSTGAAGSSSSIISKINYYLPVDTLATVILLYVSVWVGVSTFKFWVRMIGLVIHGKRAASKG